MRIFVWHAGTLAVNGYLAVPLVLVLVAIASAVMLKVFD